jgi:hypothetical protein
LAFSLDYFLQDLTALSGLAFVAMGQEYTRLLQTLRRLMVAYRVSTPCAGLFRSASVASIFFKDLINAPLLAGIGSATMGWD